MKNFKMSQIEAAQTEVVNMGLWVKFSDHRNTLAANQPIMEKAPAKPESEVLNFPKISA